MAGSDDRDRSLRSVDRLLGAAARDAVTESSDDCVDPETIAAWQDGSLTDPLASAVEAHLAGCSRCQAIVAAFVRSDPAPAVAARTARHARLAWILPIGAAAAAVLTWMVWWHPPAHPPDQLARLEPPAAVSSSTPLATAAPAGPGRSTDRAAASRSASKPTSEPSSPAAPTRATPPPAPAQRSNVASDSALQTSGAAPATAPPTRATGPIPSAAPMAAPLPPPPPTAPATPAPAANAKAGAPSAETIDVEGEAPRIQAQSGERSFSVATGAIQNLPVQSGSFATLAAAAPVTEFAARPGKFGAREGLSTSSAEAGAGPVWRIQAGRVSRSIDGRKSWTTIDLDPDMFATSGDAPSTDVCWIVGRQGAVFVTSDGEHFHRVAFPDAVDLVGVRATGASQVIVTAAGGRRFTTSDGGAHWQ